MAVTSGTYVYAPAVVDIVNGALQLAQVIGDDETATGGQLQTTVDALAAMVKGWMAKGLHVWCEEEGILFFQPNQTIYSVGAITSDHVTLWDTLVQTALSANAAVGATVIAVDSISGINAGDNIGVQLANGLNFWTTVSGAPGAGNVPLVDALTFNAAGGALVFDYAIPLGRPLRVMGGRRYNYLSRIDLPMNMWARLDYQAQPNKYNTGIPTAFFYDPQTGSGSYATNNPLGQWNSWPTPQDNTNGARFTAQRPIQDIGALNSAIDFPAEWTPALKWNLALEIAPQYGTPNEQIGIIEKRATYWYDTASQWDRESESVTFGVAWTPGARRG